MVDEATTVPSVNGYSPDVLTTGLDVVFCGVNPAATAARDGHNFSHPSNRFWSVLHLAGFTDVRLRPSQERQLLTYGCGITAVVPRPPHGLLTSRRTRYAPLDPFSKPRSGAMPPGR